MVKELIYENSATRGEAEIQTWAAQLTPPGPTPTLKHLSWKWGIVEP